MATKSIHISSVSQTMNATLYFMGMIGFLLVSVPLIAPSAFYVNMAAEIATMGLWAMSLNILIGYTGLVSFGHAAFFGLGTYAAGLLVAEAGVSMIPAILGGALAGALVACALGVIIVRISGVAFALVTLAFAMMIYTVVWRWSSITGGDDGLFIIKPALSFGFVEIAPTTNITFYVVLAFFLLALIFLYRFTRSPVGAMLLAIKENAERASSVGIDVARCKLVAFVVAGTFGSLSGSLYMMLRSYASPELLHWSSSGQVLIMTVLGGTGTLMGPFVGAALFLVLQEALSVFTNYWMLVLGVIFIAIVRFQAGEGVPNMIRSLLKRSA